MRAYKQALIFLTMALLTIPAASQAQAQAQALLLLDSIRLEAKFHLQPSGLSVCNQRLLMISDSQDSIIFELHPDDKNNPLTAFRSLSISPPSFPDELPPSNIARSKMTAALYQKVYDWEAITCDRSGNIYLASEAFFNIAIITPSGQAQWIMPDIYTSGIRKGLFRAHNGGIEGLAWQNKHGLHIAAERSQRGLLRAQKTGQNWLIKEVHPVGDTYPAHLASRSHDFAGLWQENGKIFTLERNHFLVCRRDLVHLNLEKCWDYAHVENAKAFLYSDMEFGIAEGIARHKDKLYIVVDNNNKARIKNNTDTAPLLMVYQLPDDWLR